MLPETVLFEVTLGVDIMRTEMTIEWFRQILSSGSRPEITWALGTLLDNQATAAAVFADLWWLLFTKTGKEDLVVRTAAAETIAFFAADQPWICEMLASRLKLKGEFPEERAGAAYAIGCMWTIGYKFGPELMEALDCENDPRTRARIIQALGRIKYTPAMAEVMKYLQDPDSDTLRFARKACAELSGAA